MSAPCPSFNLGSFLEKDKLKIDGSNFTNWFCTLRILLVPQNMAYVLEIAIDDAPPVDASQENRNVYLSKLDDYTLSRVACFTPWRWSCISSLRRWVLMR